MLFKKKPISAEYTVYGCSLQIVANKGEIPKAKLLRFGKEVQLNLFYKVGLHYY